jgi:ribonucleoside-diphosphate reductase alpha chain
MEPVRSTFIPSPTALRVLTEGRILGTNETAPEMISRMVSDLFSIETKFGTPTAEIEQLRSQFCSYLDQSACVMSTPIMTNAGRYEHKPLSACALPAVNFKNADWQTKMKAVVNQFHMDGMGTGFNLNDCEDPVATLKYLNQIAVEGAASGREDRPVGNMAILSVHHPMIQEFIGVKTTAVQNKETWKFNISIDASEEFISAVKKNEGYKLTNGKELTARAVMRRIAMAAHICGDPGLVFLSRMNRDNPTPGVGPYVSTSPCGEVGLTMGETCQFGYINLAKFATPGKKEPVDLKNLAAITGLLTRAMDNALEISMERYCQEENRQVMRAKRKIGLGICGLADMFVILGMPYDSPEARTLARDLIGFISYQSKLASHELAKARGSFTALETNPECRYTHTPGYLTQRYGTTTSRWVEARDWKALDETICKTRKLRNSSTIALAPAGRCALVIDASCGVEPLFSSQEFERHHLKDYLSSAPEKQAIFKTATDIDPLDHLKMAASLQEMVDEAISKTINLPAHADAALIYDIYMRAYEMNLKGITIYRNNCHSEQPRSLTQNANKAPVKPAVKAR